MGCWGLGVGGVRGWEGTGDFGGMCLCVCEGRGWLNEQRLLLKKTGGHFSRKK